jgi:hypothetical protein
MPALAVIKHRAIFTYCWLCVVVRINILQSDQGSLARVEDALRHGMRSAVALATHTRLSPGLGEELPIAVRTILALPVGMPE